jgi:hypothetical protein
VDLQKVDVDPPIEVVLEEGIDAGMLEDEVLHGIANVRCTKHPTLVGTRVRGGGGASTYGFSFSPLAAPSRRQYGFVTSAKPVIWPPFFIRYRTESDDSWSAVAHFLRQRNFPAT